MNRYEMIQNACRVLELGESASMEDIKIKYRSLMSKWHPDKCDAPEEKCREMAQKINEAYALILDYCQNYKYSFRKEDIDRHAQDGDAQWWLDRFGEDPIWGGNG